MDPFLSPSRPSPPCEQRGWAHDADAGNNENTTTAMKEERIGLVSCGMDPGEKRAEILKPLIVSSR